MNPLNAQQISRKEHSQGFQEVSRREPSKVLSVKFRLLQFVMKFFNARQEAATQTSAQKKLEDSKLGAPY